MDYVCQKRERCHISCHSLSRCIRNTHAAVLTSFLKCKVNENLEKVNEKIYDANNWKHVITVCEKGHYIVVEPISPKHTARFLSVPGERLAS